MFPPFSNLKKLSGFSIQYLNEEGPWGTWNIVLFYITQTGKIDPFLINLTILYFLHVCVRTCIRACMAGMLEGNGLIMHML